MPSTQEWAAPRLAAKSGEVARPGYSDTSASEYLDKKDVLKAKVKAVAALIRSSSRVVVYTGAGISTASGIGDYASKATNSVAPHLAKGKVRGGGGSHARFCWLHRIVDLHGGPLATSFAATIALPLKVVYRSCHLARV